MAKKKNLKITPEEEAKFERNTQMLRERIAYHQQKAREEEQARKREHK